MKTQILILTTLLILEVGCARLPMRDAIVRNNLAVSANGDSAKARRLHEKAIARLCQCDICGAEELVRRALICDSDFGPAHNTLGKIYFEQGKYYLAAWEFEAASNLLPNRGEPLNNLGLVYEQVDQFDKAIDYFQQAMSYEENNAEYLGNYLRTRIRKGDRSSDLVPLLEQLVAIEFRDEWRDWAASQLVMGRLDQPVIHYEGIELGPGEVIVDGPTNVDASEPSFQKQP